MKTKELIAQISATMVLLQGANDELRDLDQVLGDGDLGVTVTAGARAIVNALADSPESIAPPEVAKTCAKAFANANPSTMAALVAGGLLAGSKTLGSSVELSQKEAAVFLKAAADSISQRGKSQVGDKTILDAMVPAYEAMLAEGPDASLDGAIRAAAQAVVSTRRLQSKRGRASWLQDRSIGLQDPGATMFLRFLEAWREAQDGVQRPRAAVME